jgi:hypothetical protein
MATEELILFEGKLADFPDAGLWEYGGIVYNWDLEIVWPDFSHLDLTFINLDQEKSKQPYNIFLGTVYLTTITPV